MKILDRNNSEFTKYFKTVKDLVYAYNKNIIVDESVVRQDYNDGLTANKSADEYISDWKND